MNGYTTSAAHWERVYRTGEIERLGWYEEPPATSLELIEASGTGHDEPILDVGSGASTLLGHLWSRGYRNLAALDISAASLAHQRARLPAGVAGRIDWLVRDLTAPDTPEALPRVALWHDRATLHFLTEPAARDAYRRALLASLAPGGHAILATFAADGATRCSGLEVRRYASDELVAFVAPEFEPVRVLNFVYTNPAGAPRPYVYALLRRR